MAEDAEDKKGALAFPFLRLPREIRDLVYRLLLVHPRTRAHENGESGWITYSVLYSAIIFASQQVYLESKEVFFSDTEFVMLKIRADTFSPRTTYIPIFRNMLEEQIAKPVLKVIIKESEDDETPDAEWTTLVTSPEGITGIIECLWRQYTENTDFGHNLALELDFYNNFPSRRSSLIKQTLLPWDQVQGFKRVIFSDDIDPGICEYLRECMINGHLFNTMSSTMEGFVAKADRHYEQKQYHLARDYYTAGVAYTVFRLAWVKIVRQSDDADANNFRHAARSSYLKARLGGFGASLRLRIGYGGVATNLECLMGSLRQQFQENRQRVGSPRQVKLNPAFCVKMVICKTLAYLALGRYISADQLQVEIDYWMEDSTYGISTAGGYLSRTRLPSRVEKVTGKNLKELEMHHTLGCLSMPGSSDLDLKLGSLWEWLEYPEEVFVVLGDVDKK